MLQRDMGKGFELLGMMGFNVMIGLILSVTFLNGSEDFKVATLTEGNVAIFAMHASKLTNERNEDIDAFDITEFFVKHIRDESQFTNHVKYKMPYVDMDEQYHEMSKGEYISQMVQSTKNKTVLSSDTTIEFIEISHDGRSAELTLTNYAKGRMPIQEYGGNVRLVSVNGMSYCRQNIHLNSDQMIEITGADCTTEISQSDFY